MIHIFSSCSEEYKPLASLTWHANKLLYAHKHSYRAHHHLHENPKEILWDRMKAWIKTLEGMDEGDWLFATGSDLIITHPDYRLEEYIDDQYDFICCLDGDMVFGDCLLMKNGLAMRQFLKNILALLGWTYPHEQIGMAVLLSGSKNYREYQIRNQFNRESPEFFELAQQLFNSGSSGLNVKVNSPFQTRRIAGDLDWIHNDLRIVPKIHRWTKDTFCLHMGGKPLHFRLGLFPFYLPTF